MGCTDCGDNGVQRTMSKGNCNAMRSDEIRKGPTSKRDGTGMKSKNICCEGQKVGQQLKGTFLFGSLGYRRFIFKISAPGLPGRYLYTTLYIYMQISYFWLLKSNMNPRSAGLKDTVQLVTAPAGRKAAYTKFGSGTGHPGRSGVEG